MKKKTFKKGQIICNEGSQGNHMFVISSGSASVFKTINAEKICLSTLKKNDFLGELSLLLNLPRTASVEALENTEVLIIEREEFIERIRKNPEFAAKMLSVMAKRLVEAHKVISKLEGIKKSLEIMYKSGKKEQGK